MKTNLNTKSGSIFINSEPANARIFLDGKEVGATPDVIRSTVSGSHEVELKLDSYEVWSKRVTIEEDKEKTLSAVLRTKAGSLMIESEPTNAKIFLDGEEIGTTPNIIMSIALDTYEVEVRKDGYEVWSEFVDVEGDKKKALIAVLQMKAGSILIESTPTKARIYLDGENVGTTPDIFMDIATGTHEVKVKMEGYEVWRKELDVEAGKEYSLKVVLQKEFSPVGIKHEASSKKLIQLRSSYDKLSVSQVQSLPHISIRERHKQVFLCHSTISHDYEVKTINGDEIVIDHATELIWHLSGSSAYMDMREAREWLKKLNIGGYSGYHDWRLPTLEEASTLLELNMEKGNFIDPVFDKRRRGMWTDDRVDKNHAWVVTFVNGTINQSRIGAPGNFVRPVRSLKE